MDPMHKLISMIEELLDSNNNDVNKVEKIIINNPLYKCLDMDEQLIVAESITEKVILKSKKKSNVVIEDEPVIADKPIVVDKPFKSNGFGFYDKKNNVSNSTDKTDKPYYKSDKPAYKKKEAEPTVFMKDSAGNTVTEGEFMSSKTQALVLEEISQEEFNRRAKIFEDIRAIILPEQRSPEWFAMRSGKITASDGGAVLGENKHEPPYNFILKKVLGSTFETNLACYHGKKFEQVVTMMYEYKNDVYTEEFGLLGHPDYYFLGASPDGICSPYHRDKKTPHKLVGRMLEIKCPLMRKIKYSGDIKDTICPIYYWCQVQLQLECCNLDECDFIQCNIEEYKTREEWLEDTDPTCDYKTKKYGLERGIVIELMPAKLSEDDYTASGQIKDTSVYNVASFLYPPKIDMSLKELDDWVLSELSNLQVNKPHLKLHRVIYWRLIENNCTLILRDRKWFESNLERLRTMWSYVEFLRLNNDVMDEWKTWMDGLPKKFNDKVLDKLLDLIDIKKKSLDPNYSSQKDKDRKILGIESNTKDSEPEPKNLTNPINQINIDTSPDAKPTQITVKKIKKEAKEVNLSDDKSDKLELKFESKSELKTELKLELKLEPKLESKLDSNIEEKTEAKPVSTRKPKEVKPKEPKELKEPKETKKTNKTKIANVPQVKSEDIFVESCVETVNPIKAIPNIQLDSSDEEIILPDIKRATKAKKK